MKVFENNQFLKHLLYNASYFESRNSNASELDPVCHNSTDFESKFLERLSFRKKKIYNASDFEMKLICKENRFWWKFCFQTISLDRFTPKNANFCSYAFSQKRTIVKENEQKTVFLSTLLKRIRFWNQFLTTSQIGIKFFKIEQFFVKFTQLVIFCIGNFTACQILEYPIYLTTGFERKV